jgi:hypothetical protein
MIASVIAAALLLVPASSPTAAQRKAYNSCLEKFTIKGIEEKMEAAAFEAAVGTVCANELSTLRQAAVSTGLAAGRKKADLEEMIAGDIEDYQANAKDMFRDFKEKGSKAQTP